MRVALPPTLRRMAWLEPTDRRLIGLTWLVKMGVLAVGAIAYVVFRSATLDAGNVLFQHSVPIHETDTVADLYERLNHLQLKHLGETVVRFLDGYAGLPQNEACATYGCTRLPEDGEVDWSAPTDTIAALIRALVKPFPGAFTYFNGRRLVIRAARAVEQPRSYEGRVPGRVVDVSRAHGHVDVLTGDGVLRLLEVEVEHESPAPASAIIRSVRATLGLRTADLLARIEALEREIASLRDRPPGPTII